MDFKKFIENYENYPVLFLGSGFSFRYLKNSYTWQNLLKKVTSDLYGSEERFLDLLYEHGEDYSKIAELLEKNFNDYCKDNRYGKFQEINDLYYKKEIPISRFKIYIAKLLDNEIKNELSVSKELDLLKTIKSKVASIITTNYDNFVETVFGFKPLIGNDILLSNPYGSVYKIHGSVKPYDKIENIIITRKDYDDFNKRYELIKAELLSLFIHHPIIFLGYSLEDENICQILKTIFSYLPKEHSEAKKVERSFLIIDYKKGSQNHNVESFSFKIDSQIIININKLETDDFSYIYRCLSELSLPVSVMDVRKVLDVVKNITETPNNNISLKIDTNIDDIPNDKRVIAVGHVNDVKLKYTHVEPSDFIKNYFQLINEKNIEKITVVKDIKIQQNQYFPYMGYYKLCPNIKDDGKVKNQKELITKAYTLANKYGNTICRSIEEVNSNKNICKTYKGKCIYYNVYEGNISLDDLKIYLSSLSSSDLNSTDNRKLICLFDYLKNMDN